MADKLTHHALLTGQIGPMEYYKLMTMAEASRPRCFIYHDSHKVVKPNTKGYSMTNGHVMIGKK